MIVFYFVGAFFVYAAGQINAPKPQVVLIQDGIVAQSAEVTPPVVVLASGNSVEVRGAAEKAHSEYGNFIQAPKDTAPFYRDSFGEWTVTCDGGCHE